jgi:hypothetical protein
MAVALLVICALAGYGVYSNHNSKAKPAASTDNTPVTGTKPSPHPSPTSSPPPSAVALVPTRDAVALVRVTGDKTWLQVQNLAGRVLFSAILSHGDSKVFRDTHGLKLVIGNAPAVQLVADNQDFGVPHSSGNVAHVTVKPSGDVTFA